MLPGINDWGQIIPLLQPKLEFSLAKETRDLTGGELKSFLIRHPYWLKGWERYFASLEQRSERRAVAAYIDHLFGSPQFILKMIADDLEKGFNEDLHVWLNLISPYNIPFNLYVEFAKHKRRLCLQNGVPEMAVQYENWLHKSDQFKHDIYLPFRKSMTALKEAISRSGQKS